MRHPPPGSRGRDTAGASAPFGSGSAGFPRWRATVIRAPSGAPRPVDVLHDVGRSPGSRVEAPFGLPGRTQWHDRTSLAADSCGGSSGIASSPTLTGFPFDPSREPTPRREHLPCRSASQNVAPPACDRGPSGRVGECNTITLHRLSTCLVSRHAGQSVRSDGAETPKAGRGALPGRRDLWRQCRAQRKGGEYCRPPCVHSAFGPRCSFISEAMPRWRSKLSP